MVPEHAQLQIFIQANITSGKKLQICQEGPHFVSGCFVEVFYGPKSGCLVVLYRSDRIFSK